MKKLFIFDLDGTIIDSVESLAYSVNQCLMLVGLPINPIENYKYYAGEGASSMIKRSLIDAGDVELNCYDTVMGLYPNIFKTGCLYKAKAYKGLKETLERLKEQGIKLAVLTNKADENAHTLVHHVYGSHLFDYILGQKPTHKRKPSSEGVEIITNAFSVMPSQCIYVGDTATDMQTGKTAGIFTIGVTWGFRDIVELLENDASNIINEPSQLLNYINS